MHFLQLFRPRNSRALLTATALIDLNLKVPVLPLNAILFLQYRRNWCITMQHFLLRWIKPSFSTWTKFNLLSLCVTLAWCGSPSLTECCVKLSLLKRGWIISSRKTFRTCGDRNQFVTISDLLALALLCSDFAPIGHPVSLRSRFHSLPFHLCHERSHVLPHSHPWYMFNLVCRSMMCVSYQVFYRKRLWLQQQQQDSSYQCLSTDPLSLVDFSYGTQNLHICYDWTGNSTLSFRSCNVC